MNSQLKDVAKYMRRSLIVSRIMGLLFCLVCAGALTLMYFKIFDQWMCMIVVSFSMAGIFICNSYLQSIKCVKNGRTWQIVNLILAFLCYCAVIVFVVICFVNGSLKFWF
ncbi:MAG: hypothetical protein J6A28_02680 [Clostridia bacterium]|nr:hypothetical protein [Clostridia bacterium]